VPSVTKALHIKEQRIKNLEAVIDNLKSQNDRLFQLEEEKDPRNAASNMNQKRKKLCFGRMFGAGG